MQPKILLSISVPQYHTVTEKGKRAEAQAVFLTPEIPTVGLARGPPAVTFLGDQDSPGQRMTDTSLYNSLVLYPLGYLPA